jgi:hypothetical protein
VVRGKDAPEGRWTFPARREGQHIIDLWSVGETKIGAPTGVK